MNRKLKIMFFPVFYIKEIIVSSLMVTEDILFPKRHLDPHMVDIDVSKLNSRQRYLLACLISMTPGTLSISENQEENTISVHCLYGQNAAKIKTHLERNYADVVQAIPI